MGLASYLSEGRDGSVLLAVYVQPKASRNSVCCLHGESIKIAVTAPPVDGKANKALIAFLARFLGCAKKNIELQSGASARTKIFRITGISLEELRVHFESVLAKHE